MDSVPKGFDLAECLDAITAVEAGFQELVSTVTEAQFQAPPRQGGWSAGHCVDHLVLTGEAYLSLWDGALDEGAQRLGQDSPFFYRWSQRAILRLMDPPCMLKTATTRPFQPFSRRSKADTFQRFLAMHQEFAERVRRSRGLDVKHIPVQSPFRSWIRYPLGFSFDLALGHERRHLCQAWQAVGRSRHNTWRRRSNRLVEG